MLIFNVMRIDAMPRKLQELRQTLLCLAGDVRKTKGCLGHYLYQDLENEDTLCLIQEWESQRDFDTYLDSDLFHVLIGATNLLSHSHRQISFSNMPQTDDQQVNPVMDDK